jgi:uncharacterized protein YneF (UPF0154 family)
MDSQLLLAIILILVGFVLGMMVGVSMSRPNIMS